MSRPCGKSSRLFIVIEVIIAILIVVQQSSFAGSSTLSTSADDIYWSDGFGAPGSMSPEVEGVMALTVYQGKLIFAGDMLAAGSLRVGNIVAWDGATYSELGDGVPWRILTTAVHDDRLIVAAHAISNGVTIFSWDGNQWSILADSVVGWVSAMTAYEGKLVVAGAFGAVDGIPVSNIAVWDGVKWDSLGHGITGNITSMIVFESRLIAAGSFSKAGDSLASNIAAWDSLGWRPLGQGTNSSVNYMSVFDGALVVGGIFSKAGATDATHIAAWNGTDWSPVFGGLSKFVRRMTVWQGKLVVACSEDSIWSATDKVLVWNGVLWDSLPIDRSGWLWDITEFEGSLFMGGHFYTKGLPRDLSWARWDTSRHQWVWPYANGTNAPVKSMVVLRDTLFVGGEFDVAGLADVHKIGAWNGNNWTELGSGIGHGIGARAMAVYDGELIVGGDYDSIGSVKASAIAVWRQDGWEPLLGGVLGTVFSMAVFNDQLIVGGYYSFVDGKPISAIATWNGTTWSPMGSGLRASASSAPYGPVVKATAIVDNKLVVAGLFDTAGEVAAKNIAVWDGYVWSALGNGLGDRYPDGIHAVSVYDGQIVAAGSFGGTSNAPAHCIARWDGATWLPLGAGIKRQEWYNSIYAITVFEGSLIAGGWFDSAGTIAASNIASWDGDKWSAFGTGLTHPFGWTGHPPPNAWVSSLCVYRDQLFVGGNFNMAGDKVSSCIAVWTKRSPTDVPVDDNDQVLPGHFELLQNYPNPFNPTTTIEYSLEHRDQVKIEIYNALGELVKRVVDEVKPAGRHQIVWNGCDQQGRQVATGVYFYRVRIGDQEASKKMLLLK